MAITEHKIYDIQAVQCIKSKRANMSARVFIYRVYVHLYLMIDYEMGKCCVVAFIIKRRNRK